MVYGGGEGGSHMCGLEWGAGGFFPAVLCARTEEG